jgi:hypothetical protein
VWKKEVDGEGTREEAIDDDDLRNTEQNRTAMSNETVQYNNKVWLWRRMK